MRPRGELRAALRAAAEALAPPGSEGVTWRVLVRHACVGELMGRRTVVNMLRSGELVSAGTRSVPGICRPMRLIALPPPERPACLALRELQEAWSPAA
jgi:hypothetical protein